MRLFLFGAGASYGSDTMNTPPLGTNLFMALTRFNPTGWGKLPQQIGDTFLEDFEVGMRKCAEMHPHAMAPLQRAMAAYFFNFMPRQSNLYRQLAIRIKQSNWDGALATINYERLLELSLLAASIRPVIGPTKNDNEIELCLPHGCCHIFCELVKAPSSMVTFNPKFPRQIGA